jgi:calcineurin-like phosphoesterase family protein
MKELDAHWFISDLHLGHNNVLRPDYDGRPFPDIATHDQHLTENCVAFGRSNRTLWVLGDVAMRREGLFTFLDAVLPVWGKVILIRGNHDDRVAWHHKDRFTEAHEARYVRVTPTVKVYLHRYACRVWRNSHHGSYHLHGHSHGARPRLGRSMDVSANVIGYRPISLEAVVSLLSEEPTTNHH